MESLLCLVVVLSLCCSARGQLWISVTLGNGTEPEKRLDYSDWTLFSRSYANVPQSINGYLQQASPRNACSYIPPVSGGGPWLALVDDYPSCVDDMIDNVRAAGYQMIITSDLTDQSLPKSVFSSGFPVVLVDPDFALKLVNVSSSEPEITVTTSVLQAATLLVMCFLSCCLCCCGSICLTCYCRRRRSRARAQEELVEYRNRQARYQSLQQNERLARQELIESILRQLQDLQVDVRTQVPLGARETANLPIRKYHRGSSNCDSCAICVEDFNEGDPLRWLPCQHSFHPQCIDEWLGNHSSLCPLCKTPVATAATPLHRSPSLNYESV